MPQIKQFDMFLCVFFLSPGNGVEERFNELPKLDRDAYTNVYKIHNVQLDEPRGNTHAQL